MKIESVVPYPLQIETGENLRGGSFTYSHFQTVLVKAVCDGVEGWGEAMTRSEPEATALLVKQMAKPLVGREFRTPGEAWEHSWRELRVRGHTRGVDVEALSGIEITLHDCLGQLRRRPLNHLFSSSPAERVPVFAGSFFASRGSLEGQVEEAKRWGLAGAKVKIGFGVGEDRDTLAKVRKLWPEGILVADANGAYDADGAAKACTAFADLGLAWFEEPVLSDDLEGYASLRGLGTRVGAGESWYVGDFDRPIKEKLVDVVEPSVSRCGGLGVEMDVARRGAEVGIGFSPMTGMNSAISLAASLHAASACPTIVAEYNPFPNPLQKELASGIGRPSAGSMEVPSGPGLGISIDERFVKAHTR